MNEIKVLDKCFGLSISESEILAAVDKVAERMQKELDGKNPLFLVVLTGAFMFAADLMKRVNIPSEISFIRVSSYSGTGSTGDVKEILGLSEDITGRTVVVIEDIVDTGLTISKLVEKLGSMGAADIRVATLFHKPEALKYKVPLDYVAMEIPNDFIVGYGLDYDSYGRNHANIYTLKEVL